MYSTIEAIQMLKTNPDLKFKRFYEPTPIYDNRTDLYCILSGWKSWDGEIMIRIERWDGNPVGLFLWDSGFEMMK